MKYYQLKNGAFEVDSFFTFEAKHYYMATIPWQYQRQVLWETTEIKPEKFIDLNTIKTMLDPADKNLH